MNSKANIRELSLPEIIDFLTQHNEKAFRGKQIWQWIWQHGVNDFQEMNNLLIAILIISLKSICSKPIF